MSDFDEFAEVVGTKVSGPGWYLFFNNRGFVRGIQGPSNPEGIYHHRFIRTMAEARDFLCAHNQPELIKGLNKIGFRGHRRERIYSE